MGHNRLWHIGAALVTSVVVVLGWLLGIQPQLDTMTAAEENRSTVQITNVGHATLLARLKRDSANLGALARTAQKLAESVPSGSAMPAFVDQLDAQAQAAGLTLTGMTVTEAKAYAPVPPAAAAPEAAANEAVPPTGVDVASPVAAVPAAAALAVTGAVTPAAQITASNFAAFPMQVTVTGTYAQVLDFVASLQSGDRLFLVNGLDTVPAPGLPELVDATISGLVYSLVPPPASAG